MYCTERCLSAFWVCYYFGNLNYSPLNVKETQNLFTILTLSLYLHLFFSLSLTICLKPWTQEGTSNFVWLQDQFSFHGEKSSRCISWYLLTHKCHNATMMQMEHSGRGPLWRSWPPTARSTRPPQPSDPGKYRWISRLWEISVNITTLPANISPKTSRSSKSPAELEIFPPASPVLAFPMVDDDDSPKSLFFLPSYWPK